MRAATKFLIDLAPIGAFVAGYSLFDLRTATVWLMVATGISLILTYVMERKIAMAPLITGIMVGIFGGLTLLTHNDYFIKIKPTIVNLCLAAILLGGVAMGKSLLRYVLEVAFQLDEAGWRSLSIRWGLFFIFLALVNELVWRNFSDGFWVSFKLFGMLSLNILFWMIHVPFIKRHQLTQE